MRFAAGAFGFGVGGALRFDAVRDLFGLERKRLVRVDLFPVVAEKEPESVNARSGADREIHPGNDAGDDARGPRPTLVLQDTVTGDDRRQSEYAVDDRKKADHETEERRRRARIAGSCKSNEKEHRGHKSQHQQVKPRVREKRVADVPVVLFVGHRDILSDAEIGVCVRSRWE